MLNLATGFLARGREVDIVLCKNKGAYLDQVPPGARLVVLESSGEFKARLYPVVVKPGMLGALLRPVVLAKKTPSEIARLKSMRDYLAAGQTDVVVSALPYANLLAIWARDAADVDLPLVVTERIALLTYIQSPDNFRKWRWRYLPELIRRSYPRANRVVTVSDSVARELVSGLPLAPGPVTTIYNPPVILGVGRLTEQKDFATLIRAFAQLRKNREARLVLLGEGRLRDKLEQLAAHLGVAEDIEMPGFVDNPFKYMARASVTALSSEYEGLPGILIQALACGCPVVSTNCPGGSEEILDSGRFGKLVNIADSDGLAAALESTLDTPPDRGTLLRRAEDFSVDRAVTHYLALVDSLCEQVQNYPVPRLGRRRIETPLPGHDRYAGSPWTGRRRGLGG
jgi:glycosyltransferase involved in cell wall biosynthesis